MSTPTLRPATLEDRDAIASLLSQMGHAATPEQATARLRRLLGSPERSILVAELDGRVVGLSVGEMVTTLTRDVPSGRLALLVVDEAVRGRGLGRALVREFEDWAAARGAVHASLTSATHRSDAHDFYRRGGWEQTGLRFGRDLPGADRR